MSSISTETSSSSEPINDMNHESERLKTFVDWPHSFMDPHILAKSGLYLVRAPDTVACNFCNVSMSDFKTDEDEITRHFNQSTSCYLLNGRTTKNVALQPDLILNELKELVSIHIDNYSNYWTDYIDTRCPDDKYVRREDESSSWCCFPSTFIEEKAETSSDGDSSWPTSLCCDRSTFIQQKAETSSDGFKRPRDGGESEEESKCARLGKH